MKKSSGTPQQLEIHIFFLDRSLGKEKLASLLRDAGFVVQVHDDHFDRDEDDDVWLEERGSRHWIAITPDVHILREPTNMRAIGRSKSRVFFLSSNNLRSEVWAEALKSAWKELTRILNNHDGPFVARITSSGSVYGMRELTKLGRDKKKPKRKSEQRKLGG